MKKVICAKCGKIFEIEEDTPADHYVCPECQTKTFPGPQK